MTITIIIWMTDPLSGWSAGVLDNVPQLGKTLANLIIVLARFNHDDYYDFVDNQNDDDDDDDDDEDDNDEDDDDGGVGGSGQQQHGS